MGAHGGPNLVEDGLMLYLDAANKKSYTSGSSTWYDLSGNGNDATLFNTPTYSTTNGGRFEFDGTFEYLNFPEISFTNHDFTLEFWGQIVNFDLRRTIFIGEFPGELSSNYVFFTALREDGVLNFRNFGASAWPYKVPVGEVFLWNFMFYSDRTATFAVNGQLNPLDTENFTGVTDVVFKFSGFGRRSDRPYYGDLYGLKIYNRALSESEVLQNYNALKNRYR